MSNPSYGERFDHGHLLAHQVFPQTSRMLRVPRRARVTAQTYGGDVVTIVADVVARSGEWLCVAQDDNGSTWNVWVHRDCAVALYISQRLSMVLPQAPGQQKVAPTRPVGQWGRWCTCKEPVS